MKKRTSLIIFLMTIVLLVIGFSIKNNNTTDLKNKETFNRRNTFAMYIQKENGYELIKDNAFPGDGYYINTEKSICTDMNGKKIEGVLSSINNSITLSNGKTTFCDLYFDKDVNMPTINAVNSMYLYSESSTRNVANISYQLYDYPENSTLFGNLSPSNNNPRIVFNNFFGEQSENYNKIGAYVKLEDALNSPIGINVYYSDTADNFVNEDGVTLAAKDNDAYIPFDSPGTWINYRFDIGASTGVSYEISQIGVVAENGIPFIGSEISLYLTASDPESGVQCWEYSLDGENWEAWENSNTNTFVTPGFSENKDLYIRVKDYAGNTTQLDGTVAIRFA